MQKELTKTISLVSLCLLVAGCAYDSFHYPDDNGGRSSPQVSEVPQDGIYRVQSGDTLFSIAFSYGLDYRKVAEFNGIDSPYVIYPNQKIRLKEKEVVTPPNRTATKSPSQTASSSTPSTTSSTSKSTTTTVPRKVPIIVSKAPEQKGNSRSTSESKQVETKEIPLVWRWPVTGKVTRGFSSKGVSSKGIDIKGAEDSQVQAAADGVVVYAGNNLIGYGNLVIVKHNDVYLSAYAYNDRILVAEKQSVKQGDALAIIGGKGNERPLLHFEVRRDGQPIDPLNVLPK